MSIAHKKGAKVRQVVPAIQGEVVEIQIVDDEVQYRVDYIDGAGESHSRFFKDGEIEAQE